jgi:hypothetical protein
MEVVGRTDGLIEAVGKLVEPIGLAVEEDVFDLRGERLVNGVVSRGRIDQCDPMMMCAALCRNDHAIGQFSLDCHIPFVGAERFDDFPFGIAMENFHARFLPGIQGAFHF